MVYDIYRKEENTYIIMQFNFCGEHQFIDMSFILLLATKPLIQEKVIGGVGAITFSVLYRTDVCV